MNTKGKRMRHLVICLAAVLTLVISAAAISFAAEANEKVNDDRNGVVQVKVVFKGTDGEYLIQWGTGFLVNDMTVLTCYHVGNVDSDVIEAIKADSHLGPMVDGKTDEEIKKKLVRQVTVYSDSSVTADPIEGVSSQKSDFMALKLKTPLADYKPLPIRSTKDNPVNPTESVYILGFPYKMILLKGDNAEKFAPANVEVTPGTVKQMDTTGEGVMDITMTNTISSGYSGGPMVDNDGNVVGIAYAHDENQSYATASQEFLAVLTTIGIEYTPAGAAPASDDATVEDGAEGAEGEEAEGEAKTEEVPEPAPAAEPEKKTNMMPFIIGGIAVLALLGILAALLLTRKKKDAPIQATPAGGYTGPTPVNPVTGGPSGGAPAVGPVGGAAYGGAPTPDTSVLNQGANETTVLGQGAAETSVLSSTQANGSLVREKTKESISINKENFKIGRERSRVDYCISDNTAIGRHHATIIVRNGEAYLVDQNSRNFTFVNDVKVAPNVETKLKEGDKISFADEVYTYHAK